VGLDRAVLFRLATSERLERVVRSGPVPVEQLLDVRPEVLDDLRRRGVATRVYAPCGQNWFRYRMRRLAGSRGV
jgi:proline dehydrogenase